MILALGARDLGFKSRTGPIIFYKGIKQLIFNAKNFCLDFWGFVATTSEDQKFPRPNPSSLEFYY